MKFLDLISRKRAEEHEAETAEMEADPAPLEDVLAARAEKADDADADAGADILDYPEEEAAGDEGQEARSFLDDDGSYDWDLNDLGEDAAEAVPVAETLEAETDDSDADAEATAETHTSEDDGSALMSDDDWEDEWDADLPEVAEETAAAEDAEDTDEDDVMAELDMADAEETGTEAEDPEVADVDAASDDIWDAEEDAAVEAFDSSDDGAETDAVEFSAGLSQLDDEEDDDEAQDSAPDISSIAAALRADMPETQPDPVDEGSPKASSQQALLATIRAAREKAERARIASETGATDAAPAPAADAEPAMEAGTEAGDAVTHAMPEPVDFSASHDDLDDLSETAEMSDDAPSGFEDDEAMDYDGSVREVTKILSEDPGPVAEQAAEDDFADTLDETPAAAAPGRKIWDLDADDDIYADASSDAEAEADEDWTDEAGTDDAPAMAEDLGDEPARAPAASAPVDPAVSLAAMTAPKRRAGRVKTRLLGFNKPAQADPITQAMESPVAEDPTFPVGWIVVVAGPGRGASFPLGAGASKIGRGEDQAIRLDFGDNSISRDNHAVVAYDDEQRKFFLGHGGKANLVRLNDMPVLSTETVNDGDLIRIGETSLRFVALCGPDFTWSETDAGSFPHAAAE